MGIRIAMYIHSTWTTFMQYIMFLCCANGGIFDCAPIGKWMRKLNISGEKTAYMKEDVRKLLLTQFVGLPNNSGFVHSYTLLDCTSIMW